MILISALAYNTTFGAYEHVFPVFPGACEAHKRASEFLKRVYDHHKRASGYCERRQIQTASCFVLEAASTFLLGTTLLQL